MEFIIETKKPNESEVRAILQRHLEFCHSNTPIENVHALDISKLEAPDITLFGVTRDQSLLGIGALRILDAQHAELKSMHTISEARGLGVAKALIEHISQFAKNLGITRLSLETGTNENFAPARNLYQTFGFEPCDAFGEYENTKDNICMTKRL